MTLMSTSIDDFTNDQVNAVQTMVNERYREEIELQLGDSEVQLDPDKLELEICPVIFWTARDCNFLVLKTGDESYRAQYFYHPHKQFNTQQKVFNTVEDCVRAVLREQADHEREEKMAADEAAGTDSN